MVIPLGTHKEGCGSRKSVKREFVFECLQIGLQIKNMTEIIYKDECYSLVGIFYYTHNQLGKNCNEKQYQDGLELKLKADKIPYEREKEIYFQMPEGKVEGNKVDFVAYDKIAIDLKAKKYITREDFKQMLRYLKSGKYRLGLIVNFKGDKVIIKRVVNSDLK